MALRRVWRCLHPAHSGRRHSRPTGLGAVALAYAESLIGSIRRECLDHVVVVGEHAVAFARRGLNDRHHFRFVVTPEDAAEMTDLRAFTRALAV
jgi:hypothetical protein